MNKPSAIISTESLADGLDALVDDGADEVDQVEWREFPVPPSQHGQRLDKVLVGGLPEFSRSYLQQLIDNGAVTVNAQVLAKPSARLKAGDACRVGLRPTPQSRAFRPEAMVISVVHQDAHLLVIDKPAGLVVHPAPGNWTGTLLNGLLAWDAAFAELPRAGIVHRLDKETSGLMLVARSRQSMDALVRMIAAREVRRQYLALGHRPWSGPMEREVQSPIGRDPSNRLRMAVVDLARHPGKPARTTVQCVDSQEQACLVRCTLHTGRTHQIRVHMAALGHPLLGDALYGGPSGALIRRQALHAYHLSLEHPVSGQRLQLHSALPADMDAELRAQSLRYNF